MGFPQSEPWRRRKKRSKPQAERQGKAERAHEWPEIWLDELPEEPLPMSGYDHAAVLRLFGLPEVKAGAAATAAEVAAMERLWRAHLGDAEIGRDQHTGKTRIIQRGEAAHAEAEQQALLGMIEEARKAMEQARRTVPPPGPTREALFQAVDEIEGMRKEMLAVARELEAMAAELGGEERTAALAQRLFDAASTSHMRFGHAVVVDERTMMSGAYRTWILRIGGERVTEHMARECANRRVGAGVARINHCYLAESGDEWLVHLIANEAEV